MDSNLSSLEIAEGLILFHHKLLLLVVNSMNVDKQLLHIYHHPFSYFQAL